MEIYSLILLEMYLSFSIALVMSAICYAGKDGQSPNRWGWGAALSVLLFPLSWIVAIWIESTWVSALMALPFTLLFPSIPLGLSAACLGRDTGKGLNAWILGAVLLVASLDLLLLYLISAVLKGNGGFVVLSVYFLMFSLTVVSSAVCHARSKGENAALWGWGATLPLVGVFLTLCLAPSPSSFAILLRWVLYFLFSIVVVFSVARYARNMGKSEKLWGRGVALLLAGIALGTSYSCMRVPLASDESMIADFNARRADFIEAVQYYQAKTRLPDSRRSNWRKAEETREIYRRAGIANIYSSHEEELNISPASTPRSESRSQDASRVFERDTFTYGSVKKEFLFFPDAPRVENDELPRPMNPQGEYSHRRRVLYSLDWFPPFWGYPECVYRPIEPQWYLRLCTDF
jgi:hypothetical protein